jgi:phage-related protein
MPEEVQSDLGYALYLAQSGGKHASTKPLKGFGSAGVLEVVEDFDGEAYPAIYTVRFSNAVYVLHCFQKKSNHGIAMPKPDMELIQRRLRTAEEHSRGIQK